MKKISFLERITIPDYDDPEAVTPGVVRVDQEKCTGCKYCSKCCPANAFLIENKKSHFKTAKEGGECIYCGACKAICPENAIVLVSPMKMTGFFKTIDQGDPEPPRL